MRADARQHDECVCDAQRSACDPCVSEPQREIERARAREREQAGKVYMYMHVCTYIYVRMRSGKKKGERCDRDARTRLCT